MGLKEISETIKAYDITKEKMENYTKENEQMIIDKEIEIIKQIQDYLTEWAGVLHGHCKEGRFVLDITYDSHSVVVGYEEDENEDYQVHLISYNYCCYFNLLIPPTRFLSIYPDFSLFLISNWKEIREQLEKATEDYFTSMLNNVQLIIDSTKNKIDIIESFKL